MKKRSIGLTIIIAMICAVMLSGCISGNKMSKDFNSMKKNHNFIFEQIVSVGGIDQPSNAITFNKTFYRTKELLVDTYVENDKNQMYKYILSFGSWSKTSGQDIFDDKYDVKKRADSVTNAFMDVDLYDYDKDADTYTLKEGKKITYLETDYKNVKAYYKDKAWTFEIYEGTVINLKFKISSVGNVKIKLPEVKN